MTNLQALRQKARANGGKVVLGQRPADARKLVQSYRVQLGRAWTEDPTNPVALVLQSESLQARRIARYVGGQWQNEQVEPDTAALRVELQDGTQQERLYVRHPGQQWERVDALPEATRAAASIQERWTEHAGMVLDQLEAKRVERADRREALTAEREARIQERVKARADVEHPEAEAGSPAVPDRPSEHGGGRAIDGGP